MERLWVAAETDPATGVTVDLRARTVTFAGETVSFELDDYSRWRLLEGFDDVGLTLRHSTLSLRSRQVVPRGCQQLLAGKGYGFLVDGRG